jgi:hypothetical protein
MSPLGAKSSASEALRNRAALWSDPAEALVGDLLAETAWSSGAALQRIGRLVEQLDRSAPNAAKLDHVRDQLVREAVGLDAEAGGLLNLFGDRRERLGAELA